MTFLSTPGTGGDTGSGFFVGGGYHRVRSLALTRRARSHLSRMGGTEFRASLLSAILLVTGMAAAAAGQTVTISREALLDKIRGGWVGKAYGVSFGGPTEFRYQGKIIERPLQLDPKGLKVLPGQDDMYVNMALLKALVLHGLDAPASAFAKEFAYGGFLLWHANGQGRQNLLAGIPPEKSGHPLYNPHADDIDFQIEADFIGLISPGLPQAAQKICDRAGHLMNYGDGVYGGVFVSAMYAAAFIENDVRRVVESGLNALRAQSGYAAIIRDVIRWHDQYPNDWKATWREIETKWNKDRCPWGAKDKFNIQARVNGAYIALGLLYGRGDFEKTIEITTRAGQDSDCNPANAGGIVGTMLGFSRLPEKVKADMAPHMLAKFNFTDYSLESASRECLRLALENVKANGGKVSGEKVEIQTEPFEASGPAEVSFPTLEPVERWEVTDEHITWKGDWKLMPMYEKLRYSSTPGDTMEVEFTGNAIYVQGDTRYDMGVLEALIDGKSVATRDMYLPKQWSRANQATAVWLTGLPDGSHRLVVRVTGKKNPESVGTKIGLGRVVSYRGRIAQ